MEGAWWNDAERWGELNSVTGTVGVTGTVRNGGTVQAERRFQTARVVLIRVPAVPGYAADMPA